MGESHDGGQRCGGGDGGGSIPDEPMGRDRCEDEDMAVAKTWLHNRKELSEG